MKEACGSRFARTSKGLTVLELSLLPLALLLFKLAFNQPTITERLYGQWIYPRIALVLGTVNGIVPFCLAEALAATGIAAFLVRLVVRWRGRGRRPRPRLAARFLRATAGTWTLAGLAALAFLLFWGLNYARPSLQKRLGLSAPGVRSREVLDAGIRCARAATEFHSQLGLTEKVPTRIPMTFAALNEVIDRRLRGLTLPGDAIRRPTSPVKKLWVSPLVSYLGLSGVFIPFTGEPSMNGLLPEVLVPLVVAHEKAHQRGVTNEGEANFVAFLACAGAEEHPYLPYSAYLFAAVQLIGSASVYLPDDARPAWQALGPGPRRDLVAIREFWARYEGPIFEVADRVNDTYLRSLRVPEGIESYREVTTLLVALDRQGRLVKENP